MNLDRHYGKTMFTKSGYPTTLTDKSGFEIFCQTQKIKSASFKNILYKGDSINHRKLSLL